MNLLINAISLSGILILFNSEREIIHSKNISLAGNESSKLLAIIDDFLHDSNFSYNDLENIVVINGPGSFTGVRSIVLTANTINFIIKKSITPFSFFDLYENYPIVKNSSRRDLFVKYEKNATIAIEPNDDFLEKLHNKKCFGDIASNFGETPIDISSKINYKKIIKNIILEDNSSIEPFYIKKPNIS